MKLFRVTALVATALVAVACERAKAPAPTDSARLSGPLAVDSAIAASKASQRWDPSLGPVLLTMADAPTRAFVLVPDSASTAATIAAIPHPAAVTLIGRGGTVQTAELPALAEGGVCLSSVLSAAPPPRPWSVGFIGGVVAPVALDSTESLSRADSATIVVASTRLASALPNDTAGRFSGLPFVVRAIWRFTIPSGPEIVVSMLTRQINQEATPLQERTFLISERQTSDSVPVTAYSERSYGEEETIESRELLAALLLGGNRDAAIILARDYGDATAYSIVQRGSDKQWTLRWSSPRRRC